MKKIGLFLGIAATDGGLVQYAQSLMDAFRILQGDDLEVEVAYAQSSWRSVLANYPFRATQLRRGDRGLKIAKITQATRLPGGIVRTLSRYLNPLPRQLETLGCDLWIFPGADLLTYQVRLPVIGTIHDLMHRYEPSFSEVSRFGRRGLRDHRFRSMLAWARGVFVDSEEGRRHVVESYGADPARVHPLPYVPPAYIFGNESPDFDSRYSLPPKFIMYPARFYSHKNHRNLISAAAGILSRVPDIALVFTGTTGYYEFDRVNEYVDQMGMTDRVIFTGHVPDSDLVGFYRRARALVLPTFFGPTNIPPLEAFASGCPVAVSDIYGMPEQVNGAALLFDPNSVEDIGSALERLWTDDALCSELAAKGKENTLYWGREQFAERLREILDRALSEGTS